MATLTEQWIAQARLNAARGATGLHAVQSATNTMVSSLSRQAQAKGSPPGAPPPKSAGVTPNAFGGLPVPASLGGFPGVDNPPARYGIQPQSIDPISQARIQARYNQAINQTPAGKTQGSTSEPPNPNTPNLWDWWVTQWRGMMGQIMGGVGEAAQGIGGIPGQVGSAVEQLPAQIPNITTILLIGAGAYILLKD